jgi:hypothetical protein
MLTPMAGELQGEKLQTELSGPSSKAQAIRKRGNQKAATLKADG